VRLRPPSSYVTKPGVAAFGRNGGVGRNLAQSCFAPYDATGRERCQKVNFPPN
jgi:hypothetical protein